MISDSALRDLRDLGMSEDEAKNLEMPGNLAEQIHLARQDAARSVQGDLTPEGAQGVGNAGKVDSSGRPAKEVDLRDLPDHHKRQLLNYIREMQPELKRRKEVSSQVSMIVPQNPAVARGLEQSMQTAADVMARQQAQQARAAEKPATIRRPGVTITPVREGAKPEVAPAVVPTVFVEPPRTPIYQAPPAVAPRQEIRPGGPAVAVYSKEPPAAPVSPPFPAEPPPPPPFQPIPVQYQELPPRAAPHAEEEPAPETPVARDDAMEATAPACPPNCPRCSYNLRDNKMFEEPTELEIRDFRVQHVIGGHRYYRPYSFYGGDFKIRFRTLSQFEEDAVLAQVFRDQDTNFKDGNVPEGYIGNQLRYRMAMSIDKATRGELVYPVPEYDDFDPDRTHYADKERLRVYYEDVIRQVLPNPSLFQVAIEAFERFSGLVQTMQLRADDPKAFPATRS